VDGVLGVCHIPTLVPERLIVLPTCSNSHSQILPKLMHEIWAYLTRFSRIKRPFSKNRDHCLTQIESCYE
jgi:hypothetical protein